MYPASPIHFSRFSALLSATERSDEIQPVRRAICIILKKVIFILLRVVSFSILTFHPLIIFYIRILLFILSRFLHTGCKNSERFSCNISLKYSYFSFMHFQKFLWILFLLLFPSTIFARVIFVSLFPNTLDDALMEYIEIRNTGCESISLSGYTLEDASEKKYIFPSSQLLESHQTLRI